MQGSYTEIVISAPGSAQEGSTVSVTVSIKNIVDYIIYATPVLDVGGTILQGSYVDIVPGDTNVQSFEFIMPGSDVTLTANSWCESFYFDWQLDCSVEQTIFITTVGAIDISSMFGLMMVVMMMGMIMKIAK